MEGSCTVDIQSIVRIYETVYITTTLEKTTNYLGIFFRSVVTVVACVVV